MTVLILGLLLFLGMHSVRIAADGWRSRFIAQRGEGAWKGLYTVLSIAGFALIIWGYSLARAQPIALWAPMAWARSFAAVLMWLSFVLLAGAYIPGNHFKSKLHHPMVLSVKVWALAHLLANHSLADALLFGSFLVWAALSFRAARGRDRAGQVVYAAGRMGPTLVTVAVGTLAWAVFAFWLHAVLMGVNPLG